MSVGEGLLEILSKDKVSVSQSVREQHSQDESYHQPMLPDVVVFPESTEDVVKVMQYAIQHKVPIVPFAVGSSLEGHVIPVHGGISLDMMRMNRILEVRPDDFLVCVQPGVTRTQLNDELKRYGLFFPVDPGADASIGGMAATNASGTTTVRYGAMRENVRSLTVVVPDGSVIQTGSLAAKSSSGYNLTGLFVGSEGTLGVFTEIWLRVHGIPERTIAARAQFPDVESCVNASTAIVGAGVAIARVELIDEEFIDAVNHYKKTAYPVVPTLFLEFRGSKDGVNHDVELAREIALEEGCLAFDFEADEKSRNQLWEARHTAVWALLAKYPGRKNMVTDVCVPISLLAEAVKNARVWMNDLGLKGGIVGHVGDGNFHASLAIDPNDAAEVVLADELNEKIVAFALERGGTCTGEHGVGLGKRKYQEREHGPALRLMQAMKRTIDPLNLMNPGKLVSE